MNMCDTNPAALLRAQNTCLYVSSHLIHSQHFVFGLFFGIFSWIFLKVFLDFLKFFDVFWIFCFFF